MSASDTTTATTAVESTSEVKRPCWTSSTPGGYVPVKKEYILVGVQKVRVDASIGGNPATTAANEEQQQQQQKQQNSSETEKNINNVATTNESNNNQDDDAKSVTSATTASAAAPKLKGMWTGKERANAVAGAEKTERPTFEGEINFLDRDGIQKTKYLVKSKHDYFKVSQNVCSAATSKIKSIQEKDGHIEGESKPLSVRGPIIGVDVPPPKPKKEEEEVKKFQEEKVQEDSSSAAAAQTTTTTTETKTNENVADDVAGTLPQRRERDEENTKNTDENQQQQKPPQKQDKGTKFSAREHINEIIRLRTYDDVPVEERRKKLFDNQLILAPLTTVGNLPFRRICKERGADVTCGEMALSYNLNQLQKSEWSLLRRHESEDKFGLQIAASRGGDAALTSALLHELDFSYDFLDINCCCPVALICNHGCGCGLFDRKNRMREVVQSMYHFQSKPVTVKTLIGPDERNPNLHRQIAEYESWGAESVILHGRSYRQRYTKVANWDYIEQCAKLTRLPLIGHGDVFSWEDVVERKEFCPSVSGLMIGRGALIKPWIFEELKEQKTLDISSHERFEMLKKYCKYGLAHWGADEKGVATTRRFLLEWMSFLCRYVPVGLLETLPQRINDRPPIYQGRDDMETLLSSDNVKDWIKISEMLLGPAGEKFAFTPKHASNSYSVSNEEKKDMVTAAVAAAEQHHQEQAKQQQQQQQQQPEQEQE